MGASVTARLGRTLPLPAPLAVGALCLVPVALASGLLSHESTITGDGRFYERMASHPGGAHNFPYAYRIAVPWIVHVLPFSHTASFTLLAFLAIGGAGAAMFALLREFGVDPRIAAGLCLGFAVAPPLLVVLLRDGRSVDPETVLVMTLGALWIVRRQRVALALTILVGTTVHETCLFLIPLAYAVWARRLIDPVALRDTALVGLLPVAAYLVIRTEIPTAGRQYIPGYSGSFLAAREDILRAAPWGTEIRRLAISFGPLWLAAPLALRSLPFARRGLVLVALCLAAMTFAFDWGRIIFFAAPVFYVAGAYVLSEPRRRRWAIAAIAALLTVDLAYAIYMDVYGVSHGLDAQPGIERIPVY